ncbi:MAG: hypothetical protein KGJ62_01770 [Armatimonadetes bacterium]|nr:hypothetical protein [Armatimonadota bacterium]MDE2205506.1 hypothetical protein [Armatimonadota bacterium]
MSQKKDAKKSERGNKHRPNVSCKRSGSCIPRVDWRSSDDQFWIFADPLIGDYAMCGDEDDEPFMVILTSEAMARSAEERMPYLNRMVAHEASWSEIQAIAEEQCEGRWRIFWTQPAARIY